jgi:S-adenosylmethionine:diacylglycerol 3-amino-3-carboxypropyl transferase
MDNIKEISKHYLRVLAEEDKSQNSVFVLTGNTRTIFFWLADNFGKQIGLSSYEVDEVINFLASHGFVYWHMRSNRTIELTDKGYNWELHQSLFEDKPIIQQVTNKNTSITGSPGAVIVTDSENVSVNIDNSSKIYSVLQEFLDKLNQDQDVDDETKKQFKEHLEQFDKDYKENKKPNKWQWSAFFDSAKNIASVADIAVKIGQAFAVF